MNSSLFGESVIAAEQDNQMFAIFDIETTSLIKNKLEPIQICVKDLYNEQEDCHFMKVLNGITKSSKAINKIDEIKLKTAKPKLEVLNSLYVKYFNHIWVGHNAWDFDAPVLMSHSENLFGNISFLDTKIMAKKLLPGLKDYGGYSLSNLGHLFGFENDEAHDARGDVVFLSKIFEMLLKLDSNIEKYIKAGKNINV